MHHIGQMHISDVFLGYQVMGCTLDTVGMFVSGKHGVGSMCSEYELHDDVC